MERFLELPCDPRSMNALNLAFVGDCVFDLFVKEKLVCTMDISVNEIHRSAARQVCCQAQARDAKLLSEIFTEEERSIYLRGRNAHPGHLPKNAAPADYHAATALEAVFGYLYLSGQFDRLRELVEKIWETEE